MLKVLIVAIESDFTRSLRIGIKQYNNSKIIGTVSRPNEDISTVISKNKINVMFLDIHFFGISTQSFITSIAEEFPDLKIVYIGHIEDSQYLNMFSKTNGIGILVRPIRQVDIIKILENADTYFEKLESKEKLIESLKREALNEKIVFENKFLNSLVKGEIAVKSEIMQSIMYYEHRLLTDVGVRVAVLRVDGFRKLALTFESDIEKHALVEYLKTTMSLVFSNYPSVVFLHSMNEYVIIANNSEDQEEFIKLCDTLKETVQNEFNLSVSIGVGKYYENFYDLNLSYREAEDALRYRYQFGYNIVLPIENITMTENLYHRISYERKDKLIFATIVCEADNVNRLIDEIFEDLERSESVTTEFLSMWIIGILIEVGIVAHAQGIDIQRYITKLCDFEKTLSLRNSGDIKIYLKNSLRLVCGEILKITKRTEDDIYLNTKAYGDQNYMYPFSIKKISTEVGASPERINSIFIQKEGINVHDYVIEKRIEVAKDYLKNTDLPLDIIAVNVGYNGQAYFESVFKQMTNISAIMYRLNNKK